MTMKSECKIHARLAAHSDRRPVRLYSKANQYARRGRRDWIYRRTAGLTERQLNVQDAALRAEGYRFEQLLVPENHGDN